MNRISTPADLALLPVAFVIAGIAVKVLPGPELGRVHEDADDNGVALLPRPPHEREVAFVQKAHGGHKADGAALVPERLRKGLHFRYGGYDLHGTEDWSIIRKTDLITNAEHTTDSERFTSLRKLRSAVATSYCLDMKISDFHEAFE